MIKGQIYKIPHTCYIGQWSTGDDVGCDIYGREVQCFELNRIRFDRVIKISGSRCFELLERVRDHWVVDTWLECSEGETGKKINLRTHKYLKHLLRGAKLWSDK